MAVTSFSLEYFISVALALLSAFSVNKSASNVNPAISFFVVPLLVAYIVVSVVNAVFPFLNTWGVNLSNYVEDKTLSSVNTMGYFQIFPPILAIFIIFLVLLYNKNLG